MTQHSQNGEAVEVNDPLAIETRGSSSEIAAQAISRPRACYSDTLESKPSVGSPQYEREPATADVERRPDSGSVPGDGRSIDGVLHIYRAAGWYPAPPSEPAMAEGETAEQVLMRYILAAGFTSLQPDHKMLLIAAMEEYALTTQPTTNDAIPAGWKLVKMVSESLVRTFPDTDGNGVGEDYIRGYQAAYRGLGLVSAAPSAPATSDSLPGRWKLIADADRSIPLVVGCWVETDDEPPRWSAWTVWPGDPLGCDGTWGDEPTHCQPVDAPPALAPAEAIRGGDPA